MESLKTRRNSTVSRLFYQKIIWLGREDSNLRMGESKSPALPLGDAPIDLSGSGGTIAVRIPLGNAGL
jgi:hypothetical protein